jgi:hypothetical protein
MPFVASTTGNYGFGRNSVFNKDQNFDNISLLLHMNGDEGSANFIDSSPRTKIVTSFGGAIISTSNSKFGGASGKFNNIDSYITIPNNIDFDLVSGDWTIELFCSVFPVESDILITKAAGVGFFPFQIRVVNDRFNARGFFPNPILGLAYNLGEDSGPIINPTQWYHVALTRNSNVFYLYVDGTLIDSQIYSGVLYDADTKISIGGTDNGLALTSGNIDEVRITKGISRYPGGISFQPPTRQFPDSSI